MQLVSICLSLEQENYWLCKDMNQRFRAQWDFNRQARALWRSSKTGNYMAGRAQVWVQLWKAGSCMVGLPGAWSAAGWVLVKAPYWTPAFPHSMLSVWLKTAQCFPQGPFFSSFLSIWCLMCLFQGCCLFFVRVSLKGNPAVFFFFHCGWTSTILGNMKKYCLISWICEIKNKCKIQVSREKKTTLSRGLGYSGRK